MFKKILMATDLTEASEPAMRTAFSLAARLGAELVVLHVIDAPYENRIWFTPLSDREAELYRSVREREEEAARAELDKIVERVTGGDRPARMQTMVLAGIAVDVIDRTALELGAQLIVLGTHGRTGVRHAMLGSIAERVVRTAHCPVLTVHAARPRN